MPIIKYVSKNELYPAFGEADVKKQIAYVRKDLPNLVRDFVKDHELYHLNDKSKNWVWRETKAGIFSGIRHPIGLIVTILISLHPDRLKLYVQRIKKGE